MTETESRIIKVTAKTLRIEEDKITPESKFTDDLGVSSMDQTEIIMAIEEEFDCSIPDNEAYEMQTIADVAKYIDKEVKSE